MNDRSFRDRTVWVLRCVAFVSCQACQCSVRFEAGGSETTPALQAPAPRTQPAQPSHHQPPFGAKSANLTLPVASTPLNPATPLGPTKVSGGPAQVAGALPQLKTTEIIARHFNELRFCHEGNRRVPARVALSLDLVVSAKGAVEQATPKAATTLDPTFMQCIESATRRWTFPASKGASSAVTYPVLFERTE